ncbi:type 2 lanthipeptide synthetase LanM [Segetibacter sp.]|uniref:type 2 lanthipeptide synthetase LanM n=1 Tax=Segetibacter sp. TaxID=2231182 RepID=UPI002622C5CB|nr:type 2 lanthipeptide synthetase LanM [Segetibacter sp.]MCW3081697.1 type 2 lantipeptide synthetase LanM [Segetibacter sp.]
MKHHNLPFYTELRNFLDSCSQEKRFSYDTEEPLLSELSKILRFSIDKEYNRFLHQHHPLIDFLPSLRFDFLKSTTLLREYEKEFNLEDLFKKYNILPVLLHNKINLFCNFVTEISCCIEQDKILLEEKFGIKDFVIKYIKTGLGDVHQEGRSTTIVTFQNNSKIVFKPRSAGLDLAFNKLIDSFQLFENEIKLRTLNFIDKGEYCWCEYITDLPCTTVKEVETYYTKAGVMLAFLYLLQGTDIHFENLIACKDDPILIDIECLFHDTKLPQFNVLNTALLPVLVFQGHNKPPIDASALGANGEIESNHKIWKWKNIGTDALNLEQESGFYKAEGNQPVLNTKAISPEEYLEQIITGFDKVTDWIFEIQPLLEDENSNPFSHFKNQVIRIIPRLTRSYYDILENSYTVPALKSEDDRRKVILHFLNQFSFQLPYVNSEQKEQIIKSEFKAIERLDIPYFTANTSELYFKEANTIVLKDYYTSTPYASICKKIRFFDPHEAEEQKKCIRSAFTSRYKIALPQPEIFNITKKNSSNARKLITEEIKSIAKKIEMSIIINDSELTWSSFVEEGDYSILSFIDNSLYSGKLGIALFLHSISKYLKTTHYDHIIESILIREIERYQADCNNSINLSLSVGVSGLIYTLLRTEREDFLKAAIRLSMHMTDERVNEDKTYDIMGGSAGTLVALCELYKKTNCAGILKRCIYIGEHLLKSSILDAHSNERCWISITGEALTGYSHGASGIGYSLLRLYEATKIVKYRDAFYDGLRYENCYFSKSHTNWKDLRSTEEKYQNSWCHGAAGIGLSRLYAYKILKDPSLLLDVNHAIEATKKTDLSNIDHYCCGNIGRIDFLIEASQQLQDKKLVLYCNQVISSFLDKKNKLGYYQTYRNSSLSMENPTLFRGTTGIGYILMKSLYNKKLVSLGF